MEQKVNCTSCGSVNNVGQQFCGACGAKLAGEAPQQGIACPGCGLENPTGQQFCGACGTKLAGEREQEVVSVSQPEV
ncbi:MAG: zinc ribbon domain-containing protein, partial [Dehalococcoidia bacterium]|nr:zinc ribbon domain-containing protein [Dehalococcoidia bacterium]